MPKWLFKQEPDEYAYADLVQDGETTWDGISNALAKKHLRSVAVGDEVYYYHTGKEKAVVGVMIVSTGPIEAEDGSITVQVKPLRTLSRPVTLTELKAEPVCQDWELIRISRLSVMPVPAAVAKRIEALAKKTG